MDVRAIDISTSGLIAQRIRMNTIAANIANVSTTRNELGEPEPYIRKRVIFEVGNPESDSPLGVHVAEVQDAVPGTPRAEPYRMKYEPGHPDANELGYVRYPNVDLTQEMVNSIEAARAYEANVQAIEMAKVMSNNFTRLIE